jgi:hypothetical protein
MKIVEKVFVFIGRFIIVAVVALSALSLVDTFVYWATPRATPFSAATAVIPTGATADDGDSVKHWLPICKALISTAPANMKDAYHAGECLGMIEATAIFVQMAAPGGLPFRACLPENGIASHQLATVVLQWMERQTDLSNSDFVAATMMAMAVSWPCHDAPEQK